MRSRFNKSLNCVYLCIHVWRYPRPHTHGLWPFWSSQQLAHCVPMVPFLLVGTCKFAGRTYNIIELALSELNSWPYECRCTCIHVMAHSIMVGRLCYNVLYLLKLNWKWKGWSSIASFQTNSAQGGGTVIIDSLAVIAKLNQTMSSLFRDMKILTCFKVLCMVQPLYAIVCSLLPWIGNRF